MNPPGAAGIRFLASDHKCVRTPVIGHIDQEVLDTRCLKLCNGGLKIDLELIEISFEGANKQLTWALS